MKTVYLVRHGESETNAGGIIRGGLITPLTEKGRAQAEFVGKRCAKLPIEAIVASPFKRAQETAEIIAKNSNLPIDTSDAFIEWNRGSHRIGKLVEDPELKQSEQDLLTHLHEENRRVADEENFSDLNKRAKAALAYLEKRPEDHTLVVGHGLFLRILIGKAAMGEDYTGRDCEHFIRAFRTENTGISVLQYRPEHAWGPWQVWTWNDYAHLG